MPCRLSDSVFRRYSVSSLAARGRWQYHKAHPTIIDVRSLARDMADGKFMASFRMAVGLGLDMFGDHTYEISEDGAKTAGEQLAQDPSTGKVIFTFPHETAPVINTKATKKLPPAPPTRKREL